MLIKAISHINLYKRACRFVLRSYSFYMQSSYKLFNMAPSSVKNIVDNIVKSEEDKRLYRGLELHNGMKILLISDETTDKSAAALDVHIGHMSDPFDLPGLAHFCEHMLFLGTEKYPLENEYSKFLSEHSGSSNAFTTSEHTNYYFDVAPPYLKGALDRFAQFFLCPLFTESATDREVNAVNSENDKNLQNDHWRLYQLERSTAKPNHDFSKFGTGNKETLDVLPKQKGLDVRQELLKFHSKYYSSNIMAFAVLGKESLDELMEMVLELFSHVQNKNIIIPEWLDHPFGPEQLKLRAFVVPVKDIRNMSITFPIPDLHPWYLSKPGHFLGHLIGHEGPGSLLSELKAKGWVNALVGGQKNGAKGFMFFIVNVDLTEEGLEHVDDIATNIFQYFNMLKKEDPQEWIFKECQDLNAMTFRFKDKEKPESYVCSLAGSLHEYPMEEVLSGSYMMKEFRPDLIKLILNKLEPMQVRIAIVAKKFQNVVDQKEKWFSTPFKIEPIPEELLEKLKNAGFNANLKLPPNNEFIPTNFDLVPREEENSSLPILLQDTSLSRVWFKQDDRFLLPKVSLNFEFVSPLAYIDPVHSNLGYMFVQLFRDSLTEYAYSAELAGLNYCLDNTKYGMFLSINGYSDKLHVLLQKIMDKMTSFQIDPKRFEILKEAYMRALRNFHAEQPHQHAIYYTSVLMAEHAWMKEELLEATEDVTVERLQSFIPQLLSKMYIESLLHGNLTKQKALELQGIVENTLKQAMKTKPLLPSQLIKDREVQLPDGCFYLYRQNNEVHRSSSIEIYYQCSMQDTHSNAVLELFCQLIGEPCFNILRTKEQLGYIVFSGVRRSSGVQGLYIIVQSDKNPRFLDARIEAFLHSMEAHIESMSDECFKKHVAALIAKHLEKPKKLSHQTAVYWSEITSQQYNFDRDNIEAAYLKQVNKDDVLNFYKALLSCEAPKRHKLSVHILSTAPGSPAFSVESQQNSDSEIDGLNALPFEGQVTVIDNLTQFKSGLGLFPLAKPYINLAVAGTKSKL